MSADLGYDVSDEMIMMNKMMGFLSGRVVHDEVDSDYSIIRARPLCRDWADGQRKVVVIVKSLWEQPPPITTMPYTSKWTTTEQSSEALGLVHPPMLSNRCAVYRRVAQRGRH